MNSSTLSGASERQQEPKPQYEHSHKQSPPHGSESSASANKSEVPSNDKLVREPQLQSPPERPAAQQYSTRTSRARGRCRTTVRPHNPARATTRLILQPTLVRMRTRARGREPERNHNRVRVVLASTRTTGRWRTRAACSSWCSASHSPHSRQQTERTLFHRPVLLPLSVLLPSNNRVRARAEERPPRRTPACSQTLARQGGVATSN